MKKYFSWAVGFLAAVVVLGAGCGTRGIPANNPATSSDASTVTTSSGTTATSYPTSTKTSPATTKTTPIKKTTTPLPKVTTGLKYTEIMKMYQASGYRFQFLNCQATPGVMTLKAGVKFMLDNRDNETHKIKVSNTTYTIGAYSYVIATAPSATGNHYVTCDGGGSARINVEK